MWTFTRGYPRIWFKKNGCLSSFSQWTTGNPFEVSQFSDPQWWCTARLTATCSVCHQRFECCENPAAFHGFNQKGCWKMPKVDATVMDCMDVYLWNFIHSQGIIGIVSLSISIHLLYSIWTCDLEFIQTNTALDQCWAQFPRLWEYVFVCDRFI